MRARLDLPPRWAIWMFLAGILAHALGAALVANFLAGQEQSFPALAQVWYGYIISSSGIAFAIMTAPLITIRSIAAQLGHKEAPAPPME